MDNVRIRGYSVLQRIKRNREETSVCINGRLQELETRGDISGRARRDTERDTTDVWSIVTCQNNGIDIISARSKVDNNVL